MAVTKVVMPKLSEAMETGKLLRWLKQEGDRISGGDIIAEIETDKADIELEAFGSGVLRKLLATPGTAVPVGGLIAVIADPDEDISAVVGAGPGKSAPAAAAGARGSRGGRGTVARRHPRPESCAGARGSGDARGGPGTLARRHARPEPCAGDGDRHGRVAGRAPPGLAARPEARPAGQHRPRPGDRDRPQWADHPAGHRGIPRRPPGCRGGPARRGAAAVVAMAPAVAARTGPDTEDVPLSPIRAAIARQMVQSKAPVPHFYVTTEIAMERAAALRAELQALPGAPKVTFTDVIVRACAVTLQKHPGVNASFTGDAIRRHRAAHIGIAVAVEDGLITPVLRECDRKSLFQIATESRDLIERTRARKLRQQELSGATFSVSNLGMFPVDEFVAIINPPEAAILAVGAIVDKPVVVDGQLAIGKRMRVTLSADHRVVDGAMGAQFLADLKATLEAPLALLV